LVINGEEWRPEVRPFLLEKEGVLMVPLRELAAELGLAVKWEGSTATVLIGDPAGNRSFPVVRGNSPTSASTGPSYVWLEDLTVLRNVGPFYRQPGRNFMVAARPFSRGVALELEAGKEAEVVVDLAGRFKSVEGYLGIEDATSNSRGGCVVSFFGDEVLLFKSSVLKPSDYPYYVDPTRLGNLSGIKRLRIHVRWEKAGLGDYDRIVCVLARFRFFR
jgi:hypothetical protein